MDSALDRLLPPESRWPPALHRAMRHSVFAGGKRFRPILCLAAAEALGAPRDIAIAPACGIELVHTYSLVHDDLPAMDDAPLRRGAPTAHVLFGEALAILAGDALLTLGLAVLARHPEGDRYTSVRLRVVEIVADAIGSEGMIAGQVADLEAEDAPERSEKTLLAIHDAKTGRLIRASLAAGAHLAFAPESVLATLDSYGRALGLAFQVKDDLLDVESDSASLGKRAGADADAHKLTFPSVFGRERSHALLDEKIGEAIDAARALPGGGGRLSELARFVGERRS
ncbi:MAG TPA: farnesyl diphosphate synthase [Thermoanaerobaculia bacterium]|nr:farnesyl diphosphate synthase [Thermoanaerobaculia bacterium]